jgi:hypothetical protein
MARSKSSGSGAGIGIIIVIGIGFAVYRWIEQNILVTAICACLLLAAIIAYTALKSQRRMKATEAHAAYLLEKHKKQEIVDRILNGEYWKGQTVEQLEDALGPAHAVDRQVLKTKTKETWKYDEAKRGQFSTRIEIENGKVIGWSAKE